MIPKKKGEKEAVREEIYEENNECVSLGGGRKKMEQERKVCQSDRKG